MKIAEQYEQISQRRLPIHAVRQTLTTLAREAYGETFPSATVRQFIEAWLKSKVPPLVAQSTHDFYRKSTKKFLGFLGPAAELDLSAVTRKMVTEFRNQVAQKASATTTNHDLKAIKLIFRSAKRDGYIIEDPSEFVESVRRKISDDARRPFTVPEIRTVIEVADKEWKSLVLFGLYTGQRLADLATLRWDNIELGRNEIRIKTRKTGKRLVIPIAPALKTHVKACQPLGRVTFIQRRRLQSQAKNAPGLYRTNLPIYWRKPDSAKRRRTEAKAKAGMGNARPTV